MKKCVSLNNLLLFLDNLKNNFSDINHTHVISNIENLQTTFDGIQNDIDILEQNVTDLTEEISDKGLPEVTSDDNGAFLRVVDGVWTTETISNAEEASF